MRGLAMHQQHVSEWGEILGHSKDDILKPTGIQDQHVWDVGASEEGRGRILPRFHMRRWHTREAIADGEVDAPFQSVIRGTEQ
ncbi:hypothetical protein GCM10025789_14490 [Tessaracoccus lubricantis]|uniref:Uncharacterized protein n=1 Tax=Tessaracoccus lubricantis TaxID=545543 RepID=A0ABP9FC41_9ACTN